MAAASIRDVAARAGVSVGTVSNVLNRSKRVSPDTAKRVLEAIEALDFVRNDAARQLRVGQSRTVGIMVLDVGNPFFTDLVRGVEDTLTVYDRSLILGNSGESAARELGYLDLFEEQRVAGLLISPVSDVFARLTRLRERGSPVVLVDRQEPGLPFSSVSVDDRRGGGLAAAHLLDLGRTKLAFIGGPHGVLQVAERANGAREVVAARGARPLEVLELDTMRADAGRLGAERLLALPAAERPDAVFAANDIIALGVLQALIRAGVRVPDDIALIGYDDIYFAANAAIPLSSVRQPAWEMGKTATELLMNEIDDGAHDFRNVVFQPELVVRTSTTGRQPDGE